jgi:hypothetical protein
MLIKCLHGYFKFYEKKSGELSDFMTLTGFDLVPQDDYYTFSALKDAPKYSLLGKTYLNSIAIMTYEGDPWVIMKQNQLVYDFSLGVVVPKLVVTRLVEIERTRNYFVSNGLILPGSLTDRGTRVTDYSAWFLFDTQRFKYTELSHE